MVQFGRQAELDGFFPARQQGYGNRSVPPQRFDDVIDQRLRRRCACGNANGHGIVEPRGIHLATVGNEIAGDTELGADLAKPVGIGAV